MNATKMTTDCPSWCTSHNTYLGSEDHFGIKIEVPALDGELGIQRSIDLTSDSAEEVIYLGDDNLTPAQAREFATALLRLANTLDPRPVPAGLEVTEIGKTAEMLGLKMSQALAVAEASYGIGQTVRIEAHR